MASHPLPDPNPLQDYAIPTSRGAAPGYVPDRACGTCHGALYRSYQEVGMAKSFYRPQENRMIEDFEQEPFVHTASGRIYRMSRQGETLHFERYLLNQDGEKTNLFERKVDWILGSGHHSRTYLYQTNSGELYQLPIAWYSLTASWGMAPGYDSPAHEGVLRQVRRECMFCHNAYPEVPRGSDSHYSPHTFPKQLPEGIGCQRCHGPGAEHMRLAFGNTGSLQAVRSAIVNPGKLPPRLSNDVCYGCHMQPSVALPGARRFNRPDYSFRPGQALADYQLLVNPQEAGRSQKERFEINHHPFRLEQSRCFQASAGKLSCLSCHNPHRKVPEAERAAHYRAVCTSCHGLDACSRPTRPGPREHTGEKGGTSPAPFKATKEGAEDTARKADCVACHMPKRRAQDVVHVVMTDHLIQRQPGETDLLAPLEESTPTIVDVKFLYPDQVKKTLETEALRTTAVLRTSGGIYSGAADHLQNLLAKLEPDSITPYLDVAQAQLKLRRFDAAEKTLEPLLQRDPGNPLVLQWLAMASAETNPQAAIQWMRRALSFNPDRPETRFNLGLLLLGQGQPREALLHLRTATRLRSNMAPAFLHLGNTHRMLGDQDSALRAYTRALDIDPGLSQAYLALGQLHLDRGEPSRALLIWQRGRHHARLPAPISQAMAKLRAKGTSDDE